MLSKLISTRRERERKEEALQERKKGADAVSAFLDWGKTSDGHLLFGLAEVVVDLGVLGDVGEVEEAEGG